MKQELVYLEDAYMREIETKVVSVKYPYVILEKVIFYPTGGGQPCDTGKIIRTSDNAEFNVVSCSKSEGIVNVEVDKEGLKESDLVKCILDWEKRYALMRMHTAAHILASIFYKKGNAKITGNQLGIEQSRFDFSMEGFDRELMNKFVEEANSIIAQGIEVKSYTLPYEEAMKISDIVKLANVLPPTLKELRIVEIPGIDIQADGGTHVKNTKEIGAIEVLSLENKGKNNKRIYFKLK